MAAPQRLQAGSLQPSANPVRSFLNFDANSKPAAPAQSSKLGQISRVTGIQRGAQRDVQGVNPIQELAEALAPLGKLYDAGTQLYASNEYKKGQNEILKATANINRDQQQKSVAYAAQNRELDRQSPVAGILMDQANPFRQAGRVNQASKWVASQTPAMFKAEWAKTGSDLRKLDPSDPTVMAVQAKVTNQLASSFGLDEFSPGFQDYVAPTINKSWEWFQNEQYKARVAYDKEVGARQTTDALVSLLLQPFLSNDVSSTIKGLCLPETPGSKKFDELCEVLKEYYKVKTTATTAAHQFRQCVQLPMESITDYSH